MNGGLDPEPRDVPAELRSERAEILRNLREWKYREEYRGQMYQNAILLTLMIIELKNKVSPEEMNQIRELAAPTSSKKWWQFWKDRP